MEKKIITLLLKNLIDSLFGALIPNMMLKQ